MKQPDTTSSPIDNFGGANPKRIDPNEETVVLTVRVPKRIADRIAREAHEEGQTKSGYLREILTAGFR